jgi:hypothetical protein
MMWALAVAVAATLNMGLIQAQWLDAARTVPWSDRFLWPSYLLGGALFGYGMVLASGCPQRGLVRLGSGNLKALVVVLVAAVSAQMTLRGVLAVPRVQWLEPLGASLGRPQDLGHVLALATGGDATTLRWAWLAALVAAVAWACWRNRCSMDRSHWLGGLLVGLAVPAAWALTGHIGYLPEHPETLEPAWMGTFSHRPEGLTFAAPIAHTLDLLTLWSDRNNVATFGITLSLGTVLGSLASALWRKEFRLEAFRSTQDLGEHLAGAALMGFGGVTAMGCSIGQGVTGLSMLSAGAVLAVAGIVAGTWLALRRQANQA